MCKRRLLPDIIKMCMYIYNLYIYLYILAKFLAKHDLRFQLRGLFAYNMRWVHFEYLPNYAIQKNTRLYNFSRCKTLFLNAEGYLLIYLDSLDLANTFVLCLNRWRQSMPIVIEMFLCRREMRQILTRNWIELEYCLKR